MAMLEPLGDSAYLVRGLEGEPFEYLDVLSAMPGVLEAAPSYETLAVFFDPLHPPEVERILAVVGQPPHPSPLPLRGEGMGD